MESLKDVLDASGSYWATRLKILREKLSAEGEVQTEENAQVAKSLSEAIVAQLDALCEKLSDQRITSEQNFDRMVREVLAVDIMASSIEVQTKDYLAMTVSSPSAATASPHASGSSPSPFKQFLNGLLSALGSLQQWLLNILRIATTLKEWTISGGAGAGSLGLANAELSITFGQ